MYKCNEQIEITAQHLDNECLEHHINSVKWMYSLDSCRSDYQRKFDFHPFRCDEADYFFANVKRRISFDCLVEFRENSFRFVCNNFLFVFLANVNSSSGSLYVVVRPSVVCLSVCRLCVCLSSVTFVRSTQAIEIFGNVLRHLVPWPSMTFV